MRLLLESRCLVKEWVQVLKNYHPGYDGSYGEGLEGIEACCPWKHLSLKIDSSDVMTIARSEQTNHLTSQRKEQQIRSDTSHQRACRVCNRDANLSDCLLTRESMIGYLLPQSYYVYDHFWPLCDHFATIFWPSKRGNRKMVSDQSRTSQRTPSDHSDHKEVSDAAPQSPCNWNGRKQVNDTF